MSLPANISPSVLATVVSHLAPHFLNATEGDPQAACRAAGDILAAYNVETEAELAVAAEIVSLSFHALEALGQAASPDLPLNKVLRLRGGAVSLSRESHKARRRLDQLQRTRLTAARSPLPGEIQPAAEIQRVAGPIGHTAPEPAASPPHPGAKPHQAWTTAQQQRHAAHRMTETLKRNQAEHARREAAKTKAPPAGSMNRQAAT